MPSEHILKPLVEALRKAERGVERAEKKYLKANNMKNLDAYIGSKKRLERARLAHGQAWGGNQFFIPFNVKDI